MALKFQIQVDDQGTPKVAMLGKQINGVGDAANKAEKSFGSMGSRLEKIFAGAAAVKGFQSLIAAADEDERATSRLKRSVEGLGISYDSVKNSIDQFTLANQKSTAFSDDAQQGALAELIALTGDYKASLDTLPAVMDLAAFQQVDLNVAMDSYAQLMQGDVPRGLAKFIPQLKEMEKSGASAAEMMALVASKTKDAATVDVSGLTRFNNALEQAKETAGKELLPVLEMVVNTFSALPAALQAIVVMAPVVAAAVMAMGGPFTALAIAVGAAAVGLNKLYTDIDEQAKIENVLVSGSAKNLKEIGLTYEDASSRASKYSVEIERLEQLERKRKNQPVGKLFKEEQAYLDKTKTQYKNLRALMDGSGSDSTSTINTGFSPKGKAVKESKALYGNQIGAMFRDARQDFGQSSSIKERNDMLAEMAKQESELKLKNISDYQDKEIAVFTEGFNNKYALLIQSGEMETQLEATKQAGIDAIKQKYADMDRQRQSDAINGMVSNFGIAASAFKQFGAVYKTLAISKTIIDTYQAAQSIYRGTIEAFSWMGPFALIPAAAASGAAIAAGLANVSNIKSQQFYSGGWTSGGGSQTSDSIPATLSRNERVISANEVNRMGGRDAVDRAIQSGVSRASSGINVFINGPVTTAKNYVRDILVPEIRAELARA